MRECCRVHVTRHSKDSKDSLRAGETAADFFRRVGREKPGGGWGKAAVTVGAALMLAGFCALLGYWAGRLDRADLGPMKRPRCPRRLSYKPLPRLPRPENHRDGTR